MLSEGTVFEEKEKSGTDASQYLWFYNFWITIFFGQTNTCT